jgi:hypothetical protein
MLYQPIVSKSGELNVEAVVNPSQDNRRVLIFAGITVSIFHLVVLGYWPFDMMRESSHLPSLKIILRKPPVQASSAIRVQEQTPAPITAETVPDIDKLESHQKARVRSRDSSFVETPIAGGFDLYFKAIKAIRDESLRKSVVHKTFSTRDFPRAEEANPFRPVDYLPVMISQPSMVQIQDVNGYTTILRTNGFGKSWCVQERGFRGDANPPLWYVIPAETCGHLHN